jgi:hypothetical protein
MPEATGVVTRTDIARKSVPSASGLSNELETVATVPVTTQAALTGASPDAGPGRPRCTWATITSDADGH